MKKLRKNFVFLFVVLQLVFFMQGCSLFRGGSKKAETNSSPVLAIPGAPTSTPATPTPTPATPTPTPATPTPTPATPTPSPTPTGTPDPNATFSISPNTGDVGTLMTITSSTFDFNWVLSVNIDSYVGVIVSRTTTSITVLVMPAGYDPLASLPNNRIFNFFASAISAIKNTVASLFTPASGPKNKTSQNRMIASTGSSVSFTTANGTYTYTANNNFSGSGSTALTPISQQQGSKLYVLGGNVGCGVALSADGNTMITGGCYYPDGGAYVFTRTNGTWSRQGGKLLGSNAVGGAWQGESVALSADGNTALIGGPDDNSYAGAAWVFTRTNGVWTQQGQKLVGTGASNAKQGIAVALSADGNTAVVGGSADSGNFGGAWIFARANGVWTQQGGKIYPTDASSNPTPQFGYSVGINANGNTIIVGGIGDSYHGAAWIFNKSGGVYTQQGTKLVGTGGVGNSFQGYGVALSADGNTALVGAAFDDGMAGAAWVYTRSSGTWSQQGSKLTGTGNVGKAGFGYAVALSADGDSAVISGAIDDYNNMEMGASWIFGRASGTWTQRGNKLVGSGGSGFAVGQGYKVAISADGSTSAVSANKDDNNTQQGAVWIFTR